MNIFPVILPLVLLVTFGYLGARLKLVAQSSIQDISRFTFNLIIPLFLFHHIAKANLTGELSANVFVTFYGVVISTFLLSYLFGKFVLADKTTNLGSVFALGSCYSNTIIVGLPILIATLDESVTAIVFIVISFHSALLFTLTSVLAQFNGGKTVNFRKIAQSTLCNPLLIGIFSGLVFNLIGIEFAKWIDASFRLLTQPALPLALLILGASLTQFKIQSAMTQVILASVVKLFLMPLTVYLVATYVFIIDDMNRLILVILTACPTGVNAYLVASQQNTGQAMIAGTVVFSTLASAITLPLWLLYLH